MEQACSQNVEDFELRVKFFRNPFYNSGWTIRAFNVTCIWTGYDKQLDFFLARFLGFSEIQLGVY